MPPVALTSLNVTATYTELTTVFTPPSRCWSEAWTLNSSAFGTIACTRAYTSSCFPSKFTSLGSVLYSPGACPQGYNPGGTFTDSALPEVTSCVCCPERMTFNLDASNCQGSITDAASVVVNNKTTQYTDPILGIAPLMLIAWKSDDLPSFTPSSAPLLQIAAATSATTSTSIDLTSVNTSTTYTTSQDTDSSTTKGLAQDARIGIGVGTACGVLVCTSLGILLYRRRLRQSRENISSTLQPAGEAEGVGIAPKAELGGDNVLEIDSRQVIAETDGTDVRHELEGDWHGHEAQGT